MGVPYPAMAVEGLLKITMSLLIRGHTMEVTSQSLDRVDQALGRDVYKETLGLDMGQISPSTLR